MSVAHSPRHEELLPAYALDALDREELRELEAHLASGCAECRRHLELWQGDLEELAASVEPVTPSEATRRRLQRLTAGNGEPPPASARPRSVARWVWLVAAASLLLAVWSGWRQARLGDELKHMDAQLHRMAKSAAVLNSPGARCIHLTGLGSTPAAVGHAFVDSQHGGAVFFAINLPALEQDQTYQLWWIEDGKPISAGTFDVDERGTASVQVERVAPVSAFQPWAVTIEPKGGVPQPTGTMVLKG
jgi:anti-sigma-K factor RskA